MRRPSFASATLAGAGLATVIAAATAGASLANGRPPATTNVRFPPDSTETIYVPVTFGVLRSTDGGESFEWLCEQAVGYTGIFDPDYAVSAEGDIYATTFDGLRVSHDGGCTFETLTNGLDPSMFVSDVEIGSDGRVWLTTSTGAGQNDLFVSTDGQSFTSAGLFEERAWWLSVRISRFDPDRIYITGFLPSDRQNDIPAAAMLSRSVDGGKRWEELSVADFAFGNRRDVYLLDTSPTNPDIVFARVVGAVDRFGDALYRSTDGGVSWTNVAEFADGISSFLIRPDGMTVIAASINGCPGDEQPDMKGCVRISHDAGETWGLAAEQPRLACIGERSDGTLFGCGANWEPDFFALGSSQDGEHWEKVYRFSETAGPLECPAETEQAQCAAELWPDLCAMLGICAPPVDGGAIAADASEPGDGGGGDGGCCRVGGGADASWVPGLLATLLFLGWQNRRRR
jgi:photosystem II stability/assembly factor-like uncharacterized protein